MRCRWRKIWPGFLTDMQFQFQAKAFYGRDDPAHPAWLVWAGALAAVPALRDARGGAACALFGAAFLVMVNQGHEVWYDYGLPLGFLLILLAHAAMPATAGGWRRMWAIGTAGLVVFASLRVIPTLRPLLPHCAWCTEAWSRLPKSRRCARSSPPCIPVRL